MVNYPSNYNQTKTCALVGDFNIDLLKHKIHPGTNVYYSSLPSNFLIL